MGDETAIVASYLQNRAFYTNPKTLFCSQIQALNMWRSWNSSFRLGPPPSTIYQVLSNEERYPQRICLVVHLPQPNRSVHKYILIQPSMYLQLPYHCLEHLFETEKIESGFQQHFPVCSFLYLVLLCSNLLQSSLRMPIHLNDRNHR